MDAYSRIEVGSSMKSSSIELPYLTSSPFPTLNPNPSSQLRNQYTQEQFATQNSTAEEKLDEGLGEKFGVILSRGRSLSSAVSRSFKSESQSNVQSAVRRAFSMRKSCPIGEGYFRILDPCESFSPPPQDSYVRGGSKKRRIRIFRACKRLLGFA